MNLDPVPDNYSMLNMKIMPNRPLNIAFAVNFLRFRFG